MAIRLKSMMLLKFYVLIACVVFCGISCDEKKKTVKNVSPSTVCSMEFKVDKESYVVTIMNGDGKGSAVLVCRTGLYELAKEPSIEFNHSAHEYLIRVDGDVVFSIKDGSQLAVVFDLPDRKFRVLKVTQNLREVEVNDEAIKNLKYELIRLIEDK